MITMAIIMTIAFAMIFGSFVTVVAKAHSNLKSKIGELEAALLEKETQLAQLLSSEPETVYAEPRPYVEPEIVEPVRQVRQFQPALQLA